MVEEGWFSYTVAGMFRVLLYFELTTKRTTVRCVEKQYFQSSGRGSIRCLVTHVTSVVAQEAMAVALRSHEVVVHEKLVCRLTKLRVSTCEALFCGKNPINSQRLGKHQRCGSSVGRVWCWILVG